VRIHRPRSGVAYQIPGAVDSLRDRCRGRRIGRHREPVVARWRSDHRLPYETPSGVFRPASAL